MVEMLRFKSREALLASRTLLYVNAEDRERVIARGMPLESPRFSRGAPDERRRHGVGQMNIRALRDGDNEYWEGTIEDITNHRRAEEAERRAATLRAVAQLANAARTRSTIRCPSSSAGSSSCAAIFTPEQQGRLAQVVDASRQIAQIIAHMGRLTRLETLDDLPASRCSICGDRPRRRNRRGGQRAGASDGSLKKLPVKTTEFGRRRFAPWV